MSTEEMEDFELDGENVEIMSKLKTQVPVKEKF